MILGVVEMVFFNLFEVHILKYVNKYTV